MNPLDAIEIPVPCEAKWEDMAGDDRMRFCRLCRLHVHDLSEMTRREAEALLSGGGRVCVQLYRRPDGRVLTRSCRAVRGMRRAARALAGTAAAVVLGILSWSSWSFAVGLGAGGMDGVKRREPFRTALEWIEGRPAGTVTRGSPLVK